MEEMDTIFSNIEVNIFGNAKIVPWECIQRYSQGFNGQGRANIHIFVFCTINFF